MKMFEIFVTIWSYITVEPVEFLYCLMFTTSNIVRDNLFTEKVCRLDFNYTEETCYNMTHAIEYVDDNKKENIQDRVAELELLDGILVALPAAFFCLFVGNWSDYHGRKILLVIPFIGNILSYIAYIINYEYFYELNTNYLLLGSIVGISGAYQCLNMGLYGYVSDVSNSIERTMRLSILNGVFSLGYVIGTNLGRLLYGYVDNYSIIFGISCIIGALAIIYSLLIKESVQASKEQRKQHKLFDVNNVKECFRTAFKKRENNARLHIILLIINFAVFMFCMNTTRYDYLLTQLKFDWTINEFSNYLSIQRIFRLLSLFVLLPLTSRVLKINDALMASIGTIGSIIAYFIIAIGKNGWVMYVSASLQFNSMITVIIRSQCTKSVDPDETGRIFAVVALGQSIVPLIANPLYGLVYKATLETFPGTYLLIVDVLLIFAFVSSCYLYITNRRQCKLETLKNIVEDENNSIKKISI